MEHQSAVLESNAPRVVLQAPTASGKTLAYLIKAVRNYAFTIALYPTNELIWDQAKSMQESLGKLGYESALVFDRAEGEVIVHDYEGRPEVVVCALNSDSLTALAKERGNETEGKALLELLNEKRIQPKHLILLTNLDTLFLMFAHRFARSVDIWRDILARATGGALLVVDEFHLYHGYSLAVMVYLIHHLRHLFKQIILTSATGFDLGTVFKESVSVIRAREGGPLVVQYATDLTLKSVSGIMVQTNELELLFRDGVELYERSLSSSAEVKLLVIVNSVLTAHRLSKMFGQRYPGLVTPVHGLMARREEPSTPIVVGTSAIEVGVDFDAASLLFEAHDAATFIQRLGRVARRSPGKAIGYVEQTYFVPLRDRLISIGSSVSRQQLREYVYEALPSAEHYTDFVWSKQGAWLYIGLLAGVSEYLIMRDHRRSAGYGDFPSKRELLNRRHRLDQLWEYVRSGRDIPVALLPQIRLLDEHWPDGSLVYIALGRIVGGRSTLTSIPAYFREEDAFTYVSLDDLKKLEFIVATQEKVSELAGRRVPGKMSGRSDIFLIVEGVTQGPLRLTADWNQMKRFHSPERGPKLLSSQDLIVTLESHEELSDQLCRILDGQPAYESSGRLDWRFPGFSGPAGRFLTVGGDALVAWFWDTRAQ